VSLVFFFRALAISYNINIIRHAFYRGEHVYNVGFLCKRDGTNVKCIVIHTLQTEVSIEGITGGNNQTFDTDCGKVGL
jgi:hypothetical protein